MRSQLAAQAPAQVPEWSLEAQRRLLGGPGASAQQDIAERKRLAQEGEGRLVLGDVDGAQAAFDRAASIVHSPDIEMGLVRTYMQAGQYRRALAFGAHAAGAHRDVVGGTALYAWLLHIGGQGVYARRLLDDALQRKPDETLLQQTRALLNEATPVLPAALLDLPLRAAPYAWPAATASQAATVPVAGTAVLAASGDQALVPAAVVAGARSLWVRNGMGQMTAARVLAPAGASGLVVLVLDSPLPRPPDLQIVPRDPFAGSPSYAVEFVPGASGAAAWPLLHQGFTGRWLDTPGERLLGLDLPRGPRGGPVFDAQGRLAGVAVVDADGRDRVISVARLPELFSPAADPTAAPAPSAGTPSAAGVERIYESALRLALQVLVDR